MTYLVRLCPIIWVIIGLTAGSDARVIHGHAAQDCVSACLNQPHNNACSVSVTCPRSCPGELRWSKEENTCVWSLGMENKRNVLSKGVSNTTTRDCVLACTGVTSLAGCSVDMVCKPRCPGDMEWDDVTCKCSGRYSQWNNNLALNKSTKQSSTADNNAPSRRANLAVDGRRDTYAYRAPYCSHTYNNKDAWWSVDLQGQYQITELDIYRRTDLDVIRLKNFMIGVSTEPFPDNPAPGNYSVCARYPGFFSGPMATITCDKPIVGRYVIVQFNDHVGSLELCEVEVKGFE